MGLFGASSIYDADVGESIGRNKGIFTGKYIVGGVKNLVEYEDSRK